ncbi:MAG: exodeoxyribonuclease VII small subunit [Treponema sp.]|nr:exodeoxyribonuclease VII small subunit [Treponema sp.]
MAKAGSKAAGPTGGELENFEERLERLETLGERIRRTDIPLDEALKAFEEGIRLARTLERDLEKVDSRIEILMNDATPEIPGSAAKPSPVLELFETGD